MEKEETHRLQGARIFFFKDEAMAWAPPRNESDWLDGEEAWRLEPEGETEVPEIIIVSDAVESSKVDLDGKSHHEQAEAIILRREREVPGEEGQEIKKSE